MADIFLSYARADQPRVEKLAAALEATGHSIWWDRNIEGGHHFAKDIQRELEAARIVIVAWSKAASESHWVLDEAGFARDQGKLLPIVLDSGLPPLGFRQVQAIDFSRWPRDPASGEQLKVALAKRLDGQAPASVATTPKKSRKPLLIAGAAIALALAGGAYVATDRFSGSSEAQAQQVTLAILPFTSSDKALAASGQGLSSAISNGLASASGITMIAGTSTAAAVSRKLSAREIGTDLGATHLLEGQLMPTGEDQLRVILSLVDTATGQQIWSDTVEGDRQLSPGLTRQIVAAAGLAMKARLGTGAADRLVGSDISPQAYEAYLTALEKLSSRYDNDDRQEAYRLFRRVTQLAPDFAPGHAGLAYIIANSPGDTLGDVDEIGRQYRAAIDRALELDPDNIEARAAQAIGSTPWEANVEQAIRLSRELIEDHPDDPLAHDALSNALGRGGHHREAHEYYERYIAADPLNEQQRANMYDNYMAYGSFEGFESLLARCADCPTTARYTLEGLLSMNATLDDFERLWPNLSNRLRREGMPEDQIRVAQTYLPSFIQARPAPLPQAVEDQLTPFTVIAANRTASDEAAFDYLARYVASKPRSGGWFFLFGPRRELAPRLRAHPLYHQLFNQYRWQTAVVDYRRSKGIMRGLPLSPEEIPAEERRMTEEAR